MKLQQAQQGSGEYWAPEIQNNSFNEQKKRNEKHMWPSENVWNLIGCCIKTTKVFLAPKVCLKIDLKQNSKLCWPLPFELSS